MVCCRDESHQKKLMSRPVFNALRIQSGYFSGSIPSSPQELYRFRFPTNLNHMAIQQKNGATTPKNIPLTINMEPENAGFQKKGPSPFPFSGPILIFGGVTTCLF